MNALSALTKLIEEEEGRICRLWAKRLRRELPDLRADSEDLRAPLPHLVSELGRQLHERQEDALILWPEVVRRHAALRYEQRFEAEDVVREFKVFGSTLIRVYLKHTRTVDPDVLHWISELVGEATAAAQAVFVRFVRTEEVRFREAALMETVLQHVDVGILLTDAKGGISFATPPVAHLTGLPVRAWLKAHNAEGVRGLLSHLGARHDNGSPFRVSDLPYLRAIREHDVIRGVLMRFEEPGSGKERVLELTATPVWLDAEGGELSGVVQTLVDRTEIDLKIRELSGAQAEVRRLQTQLLQKGRLPALGQLASSTAHALNNFLNVVKLRLTLLRKEARPDHLDALERTVKNLGEVVSRLQDFTVPPDDSNVSDVQLDRLVREAIALAAPSLEGSPGHPAPSVDVELSAKGHVHADPNLLRELIVHLLWSAKERLPDGGRIRVATERDDENGQLKVWVEDSGPPFTLDEMTRLFDPIKVKTDLPHLALLIAAGRSQLQRWNGELAFETHAGETGAARVIRLPRVDETREDTPAPSSPEEGRQQRHSLTRPAERILVVDDEPENARMLAEVLEDEGYQVSVAHSAEVALRMWERRSFDAALLDALMPDMSGWELAKRIRAASPGARIAMVTGTDARGQSRETLALVDAVFRKPIDVAALDEFLSREGLGASTEAEGLQA